MKKLVIVTMILSLALSSVYAKKTGVKKRADGSIKSKCVKAITGGVKCTLYNNKGIVTEIINYDKKGKKSGAYTKYFSAYSHAEGYCPKKKSITSKLASLGSGNCKDKKKLKYKGQYKNGKKHGKWKLYDRDTGKVETVVY